MVICIRGYDVVSKWNIYIHSKIIDHEITHGETANVIDVDPLHAWNWITSWRVEIDEDITFTGTRAITGIRLPK